MWKYIEIFLNINLVIKNILFKVFICECKYIYEYKYIYYCIIVFYDLCLKCLYIGVWLNLLWFKFCDVEN